MGQGGREDQGSRDREMDVRTEGVAAVQGMLGAWGERRHKQGSGTGREGRGSLTCTLPSPTTISAVYANCTSWSKA